MPTNDNNLTSSELKSLGIALALLIIALSIIIGLGGFGLIPLNVISPMIGITIASIIPSIITNYKQLPEHEKNFKSIATSPMHLISR
jgi:hypothetical protein